MVTAGDPLDRPIWHMLTGPRADLAVSRGTAVRLDPAVGPFAAARDAGDDAQAALAALLQGPDDRIGLVEREDWPLPPGTHAVGGGALVQMVFEGPVTARRADERIVPLGEADWPEMRELALGTKPGPWQLQTPRYGDYYGIRLRGRIAAMAGERMRVPGMAEVSGVCTWPEHRGQGLAGALIGHVIQGFTARGDRPFLHSYAHKAEAIRLYERLGFRVRAEMHFSILALA